MRMTAAIPVVSEMPDLKTRKPYAMNAMVKTANNWLKAVRGIAYSQNIEIPKAQRQIQPQDFNGDSGA